MDQNETRSMDDGSVELGALGFAFAGSSPDVDRGGGGEKSNGAWCRTAHGRRRRIIESVDPDAPEDRRRAWRSRVGSLGTPVVPRGAGEPPRDDARLLSPDADCDVASTKTSSSSSRTRPRRSPAETLCPTLRSRPTPLRARRASTSRVRFPAPPTASATLARPSTRRRAKPPGRGTETRKIGRCRRTVQRSNTHARTRGVDEVEPSSSTSFEDEEVA